MGDLTPDIHTIVGSPKSASPKGILRSYKSLVMKWNTGKSSSSKANTCSGDHDPKAAKEKKSFNTRKYNYDKEEEEEEEEEFQISSPTLLSHTTSRITHISPELSRCSSQIPTDSQNDGKFYTPGLGLLSRTTSGISPLPSPKSSKTPSRTITPPKDFYDDDEFQISAPTLLLRATSQINPMPSPTMSKNSGRTTGNDDGFHISHPEALSRSTSQIDHMPSPYASGSSRQTPPPTDFQDDDKSSISKPKLLSRTTSRINPMPSPNLSKSSNRTSTTPPAVDSHDDDDFQISKPVLLSRTVSQISPMARPNLSRCSTRAQNVSSPIDIHESSSGGSTPSKEQTSLPKVASSISTTPIFFSQSMVRKKPKPIEKKLECTLEELCLGCVKKINITRDAISSSGLIVQEEEMLSIKVNPGWTKGTKIMVEGKGDERPGTLPADIIFNIEEKIHPMFQREGDDLELGVEVPLVQALTGCTISVPLLGGGEIPLSIDDIIYPGYEKIIPGQGMPKSKEEGRRGDLRLKFLVGFPDELSDEQRSEVVSILECS
ncbi:flocculation protein FLO11-like [Sesamum indicum]|uniref:Flocculation protein FLO11-like n=1 Tax=Sesamum indicum TaxID=4182 RepID=A0A6I9U0T5_SESIN|nr:flocculation protein FLO11-like [Sesamum indicum]